MVCWKDSFYGNSDGTVDVPRWKSSRKGKKVEGVEKNRSGTEGREEWNLRVECEWQDSNLRTPARTDLESVTFGLSVTLASGMSIQ